MSTRSPTKRPPNSRDEDKATGLSLSLVKAMGGPSSGKAGVSRDPEETNRIIAEASKNSKYFQEVKRRDEQLTKRIESLLHERDSLLKSIDMAKAELHADHLVTELEAARDLSKIIVHVDLDAFYASVELLDDPSLADKPFGVGHGVLSTANYEARKYGVRSGMATFIARKLCPQLVLVTHHFSRYMEKSGQVMAVLQKYDPDMCVMGADEAYLTLNDYCDTHNLSPEDAVQRMRAEVKEVSQLTCSAGIAPNRMLAKICSDRNKPNGQFSLERDASTIVEFMRTLPLRKIPGIGRVTERVLTEMGIVTCGDVYTHRGIIEAMDKQLGLHSLLEAYLGLGSNVVEPPSRGGRKSIGVESTFHPISDKDKLLEKLDKIATELEEDMKRTEWTGKTITLKYKLDTHQNFTRAKAMSRYVMSKDDILPVARELLLKELPLCLRLLGIRITTLKDLRPSANGIEKFFSAAKKPDAQQGKKDTTQFLIDESLLDDSEPEVEEGDFGEPIHTSHGSKPNSTAADGQMEGPSRPKETGREPVGNPETAGEASPRSSPRKARRPDEMAVVEFHVCPICSKELHVDNARLNAHVDYCLSKDMIRLTASLASNSNPSGSNANGKETSHDPPPNSSRTAHAGPSGSKRKLRAEEREEDGRGRPKSKKSGSGSSGQKSEFRLSQSEFGKAGFTRIS